MIVRVDPASPVPVFEQLRAQIERLIVSGQLTVGSTLPPIRHLAADLVLARGTVNKVYDALARDGLVEAAGRNGTVVRRATPVTLRVGPGRRRRRPGPGSPPARARRGRRPPRTRPRPRAAVTLAQAGPVSSCSQVAPR